MTTPNRIQLLGIFGIVLFLSAKLFFVLVPVFSLGGPRLGDDALFYLLKGQRFYEFYDESSPAAEDIKEQIHGSGPIQANGLNLEWRAFLIVSGAMTPGADLLSGAIQTLKIPLKWSFAVWECLVALAMTAGIFLWLKALFGTGVAGIALILLTFAILPNQGMHYMVPSTFALSMALILGGLLVSHSARVNPIFVGLFSFYVSSVHLLGKVHLFFALVTYIVFRLFEKKRFARRDWAICGAFAAGVLAWLISAKLTFLSPPKVPLGFMGLVEAVRFNIGSALDLAGETAIGYPLIFVPAFLSLFIFRKQVWSRALGVVCVVVSGLLFSSLFHALVDYPADAFSRVWVIAVIFVAGLSGRWMSSLLEARAAYSLLVVGILLLFGLAGSFGQWQKQLFYNLNNRELVLNEERFKQFLGRVTPDRPVLYMDELGLLTGLALGGHRYPSLVWSALHDRADLQDYLRSRVPQFGFAIPSAELNSLYTARAKNWMKRRHGFHAPSVQLLEVSLESTSQPLFLHIVNPAGERLSTGLTVNGQPIALELEPREERWMDLGKGPAKSLFIELPNENLWIAGISVGEPGPEVMWPWDSNVKVIYSLRKPAPGEKSYSIDFSLASLLKQRGGGSAESLLSLRPEVVSDVSGVVIFRMNND